MKSLLICILIFGEQVLFLPILYTQMTQDCRNFKPDNYENTCTNNNNHEDFYTCTPIADIRPFIIYN